jgi:3-mercaptopyruvate sulfurtransferase SseA
MGLERVAHIDGGFSAWKAAGAPVAERGASQGKADKTRA